MYIEDDGFSNAYKKMCLYLLKNGEKSCPRNMGTQEIEGAMIRVKNPRTRMINHELRNVSISFAIGEWLWHMEGRNDLKMIQYYAPSYYKYSDDGKTLNGAYGPRIKKSLTKIVETLKKDPDSRRAVVPIYGKEDAGLDSNDIPCTIGFQFLIRNNKLDMIVNMRSNDIFLGFPYDIFNFTMWQEYVSCKLNIDIGTYTHIANSLHFYEKDREKIINASMVEEVKENEMEKKPKEDLETQLSLLYEIEEKIRNKQEYDISKQNDYFSKITKELEKYNNKIRMR